MIFSLWHVALTALVAAGASLVVLRWRFRELALLEAILVAIVIFVAVAGWRTVGNSGPLNDDTVPPISPNDVLAPIATYALLGVYAGFRLRTPPPRWDEVRSWLVVIAFVVNVVVI